MKRTNAPTCRIHKSTKEWQPAIFEYSEDGITVSFPNVYAWVCPRDGEASFTPATTDELLLTVRDLLASAQRAKTRHSVLTEYIVSVR